MELEQFEKTPGTTLRRLPERGRFDRETVYSILDEAFACHVAFAVDGKPVVIPTSFGRDGDTVYIHGSAASRMMRELAGEVPVCVTVTIVDGLVLARSAFHHSINYRSVVIFGSARVVEEPQRKMEALRIFTEHIIPGRWEEVRWPDEQELKATTVLAIELNEVSAKVRTGPPRDDDEDMSIPVWAGVLPLATVAGEPIADPQLAEGIDPPSYVLNYSRGTAPKGEGNPK